MAAWPLARPEGDPQGDGKARTGGHGSPESRTPLLSRWSRRRGARVPRHGERRVGLALAASTGEAVGARAAGDRPPEDGAVPGSNVTPTSSIRVRSSILAARRRTFSSPAVSGGSRLMLRGQSRALRTTLISAAVTTAPPESPTVAVQTPSCPTRLISVSTNIPAPKPTNRGKAPWPRRHQFFSSSSSSLAQHLHHRSAPHRHTQAPFSNNFSIITPKPLQKLQSQIQSPRVTVAAPAPRVRSVRRRHRSGAIGARLVCPPVQLLDPDAATPSRRAGLRPEIWRARPGRPALSRAQHGLDARRKGHDRLAHEGPLHGARPPALPPPAHAGGRDHGRRRHRAHRAYGRMTKTDELREKRTKEGLAPIRSRSSSRAGSTCLPTCRCCRSRTSGW